MFIDRLSQAPDTFDLCVIGAGPAGIVTALEFARRSPERSVLLVEFGGPGTNEPNRLDDSIEVTNLRNHHPPYQCTNKGLGGSSRTWGGRCVMYDEADFVDRPILRRGCTWARTLWDELQAYVQPAAEYFECGLGVFDLDRAPAAGEARIAEGFVRGDFGDNLVERWSMPTRFGPRYRQELASLRNLFVLLGHEARDFGAPAEDGRISSVSLRAHADGPPVAVYARAFVIAAGTQESTRLLLRNLGVFRRLGRPPTALGRFYQGHVSGKIASVRFNGDPGRTDFGFLRDPDGTFIRRRLQASTEALVRENLLNAALWLDNPLYVDPSHRSGAMSFMYLAMITPLLGKRLAPPAIAESITKGKVEAVPEHMWNVVREFPRSLATPASIFVRRYLARRKLPGVFLHSPENRYALHFHAEQQPHPDNRMELAPDGESLRIHYSLTEDDVQSVIRTHELLDAQLRRSSCGALEYWYPREMLASKIQEMSRDGIHQSGTLRIGESAEIGVVDEDLLVFGTRNLFVCSSAVFPTSGQANPTFFEGVFAVRLARSLRDGDALG